MPSQRVPEETTFNMIGPYFVEFEDVETT